LGQVNTGIFLRQGLDRKVGDLPVEANHRLRRPSLSKALGKEMVLPTRDKDLQGIPDRQRPLLSDFIAKVPNALRQNCASSLSPFSPRFTNLTPDRHLAATHARENRWADRKTVRT
jgi:hypothetical protein